MELLTSAAVAPTHELIRVREPMALKSDSPAPDWVGPALRRTPWVVVRRGYVRDGLIPVGVRGRARHERFAASLAIAEIANRLSPEEMARSKYAIESTRWEEAPALPALARVMPILDRRNLRGGPGGSVGFEIATGVATATSASDLDLIIRRAHGFEPGEAMDLLVELTAAASPVRIDVMIETPCGGALLADLVGSTERVLVRTADGPRLLVDPWMEAP